jgi:hypothetical protein
MQKTDIEDYKSINEPVQKLNMPLHLPQTVHTDDAGQSQADPF